MNKLSLVNNYMLETDVIASPVATLANADGDVRRAAYWVETAWESFQRDFLWPFRRAEGSFTVTAGKQTYSFADLSIESGDIIIPSSFYSAAGSITQESYFDLRHRRRVNSAVDPSRVTHLSVKQGVVDIYPMTNVNQTIAFDYWRKVQQLVNDNDVPYGLPEDYHQLIVHLAVAKFAATLGGEEGTNLYAMHGQSYAKIKNEYKLYAGVDGENDVRPATRTLGV